MKVKSLPKCEGRFSGLRGALSVALETYLEIIPNKKLTEDSLIEIAELVQQDTHTTDLNDPYFDTNRIDKFRKSHNPNDSFSYVPLLSRKQPLSDRVYEGYLQMICPDEDKQKKLMHFVNESSLGKAFDFKTKDITIPKSANEPETRVSLGNYYLKGNFGIGNGDKIRSDTPFNIDVYEVGTDILAFTVGFWYQDNSMLVSQIQAASQKSIPEGCHLGIMALGVAEKVARELGAKTIQVYSKKNHPLFLQDPDKKARLCETFACLYDKSARVMGYDGSRDSRNKIWTKNLN